MQSRDTCIKQNLKASLTLEDLYNTLTLLMLFHLPKSLAVGSIVSLIQEFNELQLISRYQPEENYYNIFLLTFELHLTLILMIKFDKHYMIFSFYRK